MDMKFGRHYSRKNTGWGNSR